MIHLETEKNLWKRYKFVCGIDEVGRGCFAGPVVAAAVILPPSNNIPSDLKNVNDSKKLHINERLKFSIKIRNYAIAVGIGKISSNQIDKINILQATFAAMTKAIHQLSISPTFLLIDGNRFSSSLNIPYQTVIKGDQQVFSIACASILAKVYRDNLMKRLSHKFPVYGFETNVGYGTKKHIEAIKKYGICLLHRKTFIHFNYPRTCIQ